MFYGRSAVQALHVLITRRELPDQTPEYPSMNPVLGVLLLGALVITAFRSDGRDRVGAFLLLFFWGMFGVFTFIEKGNPPGRLDPVSWIWVEATIIPAVILAGARLAGADGDVETRGRDGLRGRAPVRGGDPGIGGCGTRHPRRAGGLRHAAITRLRW